MNTLTIDDIRIEYKTDCTSYEKAWEELLKYAENLGLNLLRGYNGALYDADGNLID